MNKYNFDFGDTVKITITGKKNIYFCGKALDLLGKPKELNIGIDRTQKVLGIRKADKTTNARVYKISNSSICCRKLINDIKELCDSTTFMAEYDKELDMLIVVLR